ncbi:hypothetical protein [Methanothrix sp.]|uniref:hypothetical protein n=1 Tax=Methanothrix sp. TaxID=90426 RepID=UPI003C77AA50
MKFNVAVLILCVLWLSGGTCSGSNTITHTNTAVAESAGWSQSTVPGAHIGPVQIQSTFTAVLGEGNMVSQSNTAGAYGSGALQIQDNAALVEGNRNSVAQDNVALVIGDTETDYRKLVQKNLLLILGSDNVAVQSNTASSSVTNTITTDSDVAVQSSTINGGTLDSGASYPTEQVQVNVGFILGDRNWLYQSNRATLFRHIMGYPFLWKRQSNRAIAVNNGQPAVIEEGV